MITKKEIKHLADLARIELTEKEEGELVRDLGKILGHFTELNGIDTSNVAPLTGGMSSSGVFRDDEPERTSDTGKGKEQFPESFGGFLKVPKVFE